MKKSKSPEAGPVAETADVGRPTKYLPEYGSKLIEHMGAGLSFESFAAIIGVHRDTLYEWDKSQPEFSDAIKRAKDACQLFWEKLGIDHVVNISEYDGDSKISTSKSLNSAVWIFNMKNRFKWRDKQPDENDSININLTLADRMAKARARVVKK
jgi:DNA-binding XRE family transcriptional regulator